ncbi:hypothetical protein CVT26_011189 [Gymnopilus dilepis]|uniref:Uncharacterized protein n=1 Tax=Gymnopilus dilepis TaxID=231916 RepID=A0A409VJQ9_9AGAR|nr:hypothetical protein CVT26_011189 [Gymnopilus dilepis]
MRLSDNGRNISVRDALESIIAVMPLRTNIFGEGVGAGLSDLAAVWPGYDSLFDRFHAYERSLFGLASCTQKHRYMQDLLKAGDGQCLFGLSSGGGNTNSSADASWNSVQCGQLCSLLCLYWLIDLLSYLRKGEPVSVRTPKVSRYLNLDGLHRYGDLADWTVHVFRFRDITDGKGDYDDGMRSTEASASWKLLSFLKSNAYRSAKSHVIANLAVAAMHLAFIKDYVLSDNALPDLPDQINDDVIANAPGDVREFLTELGSLATFFATSRTRTVKGGQSLACFRGPLQLALAISPLYLLCPAVLCKKPWSRRLILSAAFHLGNEKPTSLLESEKAIWTVLLSMADGDLDPLDAPTRLKEYMPWGLIDSAKSCQDRFWFKFDRGDRRQADQASHFNQSANLASVQDSDISKPFRGLSDLIAHGSIASPNLSVVDEEDELRPENFDVLGGDAEASPRGKQFVDDVHMMTAENMANVALQGEASALRGVPSSTTGPEVLAYSADEGEAVLAYSADEGEAVLSSESSTSAGDDAGCDVNQSGLEDWDMQDADYESSDNEEGRQFPVAVRRSDRLATLPKDFGKVHASASLECDESSSSGHNVDPLFLPGTPDSESVTVEFGSPAFISPVKHQDSPGGGEHSSKTIETRSSRSFDFEDVLLRAGFDVDNSEVRRESADEIQTVFRRMRLRSQNVFRVFGAAGRIFMVAPESHHQLYLSRLKSMLSTVEKSYVRGESVHLSDPSRSAFEVYKSEDFAATSYASIISKLVHKNIVVTGASVQSCVFSREAVDPICHLYEKVQIRDQSRDLSPDCLDAGSALMDATQHVSRTFPIDNFVETPVFTGCLRDIVEESENLQGKIMDAPHISLPCQERTTCARSSNYPLRFHAATALDPQPVFGSPGPCLRWASACTGHAVSFFRLPPQGTHCFANVSCGKQIWFIANGRSEIAEGNETRDDGVKSLCDMEAVVLEQGDFIFVRGNQPFATYALEASVVRGEYFYSSTLMRNTALGLIRGLIMGESVVDRCANDLPVLRRRLVDLYRLGFLEGRILRSGIDFVDLDFPDVHTFMGFLDFLSLCSVIILGNVLDARSYAITSNLNSWMSKETKDFLINTYDFNDIILPERLSMMYARGLAFELLDWAREFVTVTSSSGAVLDDFPTQYLLCHMAMLLREKKTANAHNIWGVAGCDYGQLKRQLENVAMSDPKILRQWGSLDVESFQSLEKLDHCTVICAESPVRPAIRSQLVKRGCTRLDARYLVKEGQRGECDRAVLRDDVDHLLNEEERVRKRARV